MSTESKINPLAQGFTRYTHEVATTNITYVAKGTNLVDYSGYQSLCVINSGSVNIVSGAFQNNTGATLATNTVIGTVDVSLKPLASVVIMANTDSGTIVRVLVNTSGEMRNLTAIPSGAIVSVNGSWRNGI